MKEDLFFDFQIRTRYAETDQMGVIYYGNYPQYLELGRVEWLRSLGISYKELEKEGVLLPVVSLQINYKKPALYDEFITVRTRVKKLPTTKIEFDYELFNQKNELISTASTTLVFVDATTWKPMSCPKKISEIFTQFFQEK